MNKIFLDASRKYILNKINVNIGKWILWEAYGGGANVGIHEKRRQIWSSVNKGKRERISSKS